VQHLGEGLGTLDRERLQRVRPEVLPSSFHRSARARTPVPARDGEERHVVWPVTPGLADVVGEAEPLTARLTREVKARELGAPGVQHQASPEDRAS